MNTTDVYVAVITTAHARFKLCACLEKFGDFVAYFDTSKPGEENLPSSYYLGRLKD